MRRLIAACIALLALWTAPATGQDVPGPGPYLRVAEERDGEVIRLEVAIRTFSPANHTAPSIALVGAVHIADPAYYERVQAYLDAQDVVLFEGVKPEDQEQQAPDRPRNLQQKMADSLGLVFQLDAIDYDRPNWRNADMSVEQVHARFDEAGQDSGYVFRLIEGNTLQTRIASMMFRLIGLTPATSTLGKLVMIDVLARAEDLLVVLPEGLDTMVRVLIDDRNHVVLEHITGVSHEEVSSVAVFYGAGHMTDLESALTGRLGYTPTDEQWLPAVSVDLASAGIPTQRASAIRATVKWMLDAQIASMRRALDRGADREPAPQRLR